MPLNSIESLILPIRCREFPNQEYSMNFEARDIWLSAKAQSVFGIFSILYLTMTTLYNNYILPNLKKTRAPMLWE